MENALKDYLEMPVHLSQQPFHSYMDGTIEHFFKQCVWSLQTEKDTALPVCGRVFNLVQWVGPWYSHNNTKMFSFCFPNSTAITPSVVLFLDCPFKNEDSL